MPVLKYALRMRIPNQKKKQKTGEKILKHAEK